MIYLWVLHGSCRHKVEGSVCSLTHSRLCSITPAVIWAPCKAGGAGATQELQGGTQTSLGLQQNSLALNLFGLCREGGKELWPAEGQTQCPAAPAPTWSQEG